MPAPLQRAAAWHGSALVASALLAALYVRGGSGWVLGFGLLVPWLICLDRLRSLWAALGSAVLMSVLYTAAAFAWFGAAIGRYSGVGELPGTVLLLLAAPLFQPQFIALALVRQVLRRTLGPVLAALAGAAAWVATEAFVPRLLGDTLGLGLYPSPLLRQGAAAIGAAGLTLALLLANEALAAAWRCRGQGLRAAAPALALAGVLPLLLAGLGWALQPPADAAAPTLRMGLVQSNIVDYERLRREKGAGAVVREVLDTHYAMSYDAVERQRVQALLWSETVYPTTFARPKSEAGAELDREIVAIVNAAGVPLVFGTYDRDDGGEYNAAAFVAPGSGLVGFYRKTRPFPLSEFVPAWADGPTLRRWLPWAGGWRSGDGARVLPLRLADGRELPALPLICLDAVDSTLAIAGARLGAQLILALSNDAWFTEHPLGAELHLAVAAFRSIETGLPQFRATSNGLSAVIDRSGRLLARSRMGERMLVVGELPVPDPRPTPLVRWGNWVGHAAAVLLAALATLALVRQLHRRRAQPADEHPEALPPLPLRVALLSPPLRAAVAGLRIVSRGSLLVMALAALLGHEAWQANTLAQLRQVAAFCLAPELAAWALCLAFGARLDIADGRLRLARDARSLALALHDIQAVQAWRLPLPAPGARLLLASGKPWRHGIAGVDAELLQRQLQAAGAHATLQADTRLLLWARARRARRPGLLDRRWMRFGLLPLVLSLPAFRLHQHIAYGGGFGEWLSFGPLAYAQGLLLWWAAWAVGVLLAAAVLRTLVEGVTLALVRWRPQQAVAGRRALHAAELGLLYLGLPAWLAWRALAG